MQLSHYHYVHNSVFHAGGGGGGGGLGLGLGLGWGHWDSPSPSQSFPQKFENYDVIITSTATIGSIIMY